MKTIKVVLQNAPSSEREKHATYMREWRSRMTVEQRKKNSEQAKIRMKAYRQRKLEKQKTLTPRTRQEEKKEEERKRKQRERKAKYRATLSSQKKRRLREKDSKSKREKRAALKASLVSQTPSETRSGSHVYSNVQSDAFKKYVYRRCKMPKSPNRYAQVVKRLATNVTPKRKAALEKEGITTGHYKKNLMNVMDAVKAASETLKGRTDEQQKKKRAFFKMFKSINKSKETQQLFCCATGIKRKYLNKTCLQERKRKHRNDALPSEIERSVTQFYEDETISMNIPDKKAVGKDLEPKKVMQTSLNNAYNMWIRDNEDKKISYPKFCQLKPKNILTQKHRKLFQCLCEYCENVKLKLKCLNSVAEREHIDIKEYIKDEHVAVRNTLCPTAVGEKFANLKCIDRKCDECGTKLLKQKVQPMLDSHEEIKWSKWEMVTTTNPKTKKDITKQGLITKSGTVMSLWYELEEEITVMSRHLFEAFWQQDQFSKLHLKENFPNKTLSLTIDFAENYSCFAQNEIQGAHWAQDSVTLHPLIARYRCPSDGCNEIVEECIDIVSDDLSHDYHAVHAFMHKVFQHIEERQVEVEHAIVISDGCATQYKSKVTFMDVSCSKTDFGLTMERCYYGSRHGKNRCDGEAGVVKSMARRAVKNGTVIKDAESFFHVTKKLEILPGIPCNHKLRKILYIQSTEILRDRPFRNAKTVPGTRKIHSVRGISRGKLMTRRLSCFCHACLNLEFDQCKNSAHVDEWETVNMKPLIAIDDNMIHVNLTPIDNTPVLDNTQALMANTPILLDNTQGVSDNNPALMDNTPALMDNSTSLPSDLDFLELGTDQSFGDISITSSLMEASFSDITESSYSVGTYLSVRHGSEIYPAVVENWPYVKFFQKGRKAQEWSLQELKFTILHQDVVKSLPPPDIVMAGCRVFYKFKEFGEMA